MRDISEIIVDGDMGELEDAIKKGADVNEIYTDSENQTPLFYSSYEQSKLLIAAGADVNHVNNYNQNALFFLNNSFCHNRDGEDEPQIINIEKKIKLLVENNINLNHIDNIGENFLFNININIETVKICEKFNADFNCINNKGENALDYCFDSEEMVKMLLSKNIDILQNPDFYKRNPHSSEMIEQKRMDYLLEKVNNEKKNLEKILENSVLQKNQTIKKRI